MRNLQFNFNQPDKSPEIKPFPHIFMFGTVVHKKVKLELLKKHYNPGLEICYSWDGKFTWDIEGTAVQLNPGDVSVTLPWQEHSGKDNTMNMGTLTWIIIAPEVFTKKGRLKLGSWCQVPKDEENRMGRVLAHTRPILRDFTAAGELFKGIYTEVTERSIGWKVRVNFLVSDMLLQITRRLTTTDKSKGATGRSLQEVIRLIDQDLARTWTVEDMAATSGLKTTAFTRAFKKETGSAPLRFVIERRIDKARGLLTGSDLPITDIAFELGFSSSQHFANTFKKHVGKTPKEIRNKKPVT